MAKQQVLQDLLTRVEQKGAEYEAASQTPTVTENVLREDGASTAKTPASSTPSNLSPVKQAIVQKAMQQLDAYQKEHGITPQKSVASSPQVSPKLSPAKQSIAQKAMQELEVYRKERGITPRQSAPVSPTTSNTTRQRSTSKGEKTPQANVPVSPNTGTSLDMPETSRYNWGKTITSLWSKLVHGNGANRRIGSFTVAPHKPYPVLFFGQVAGGRSRSSHRYHANKQFYARLQADPAFKKQMDTLLGIDVMAHMASGKGALRNPSPEVVWHHPIDDPSALELVYKKDHEDPKQRKYFHYLPHGSGGYSTNF